MFEKITLAVDTSEQAKRATAVASELAKAAGGEILIVHVHVNELVFGAAADVSLLHAGRSGREAQSDGARIGKAILEDALSRVQRTGATARTELRIAEGEDVARAIIDSADDFGADIIVMGSRAHHGLSALIGESVARKVLHNAKRPVCAVP